MTTALTVVRPPQTALVLAQSAWDRFFADVLAKFREPNPELCRDLALDKTIRALGHRPRAPLTPEEREELQVRAEVESIIQTASRPRTLAPIEYLDGLYGDDKEEYDTPELEDICDEAAECCEVA